MLYHLHNKIDLLLASPVWSTSLDRRVLGKGSEIALLANIKLLQSPERPTSAAVIVNSLASGRTEQATLGTWHIPLKDWYDGRRRIHSTLWRFNGFIRRTWPNYQRLISLYTSIFSGLGVMWDGHRSPWWGAVQQKLTLWLMSGFDRRVRWYAQCSLNDPRSIELDSLSIHLLHYKPGYTTVVP